VVGLIKRYGGRAVVNGLSLTAAFGAVTAVLGPNGAGKTTTIETCEGFRQPDSGSVRVLGLDPGKDARQLRPRVGVMLQEGGIYGSVSPHTALNHAAALYAHPHTPADLLDRLGLGAVADTSFKRLSGGQQQRLGIALAVIGRPELVFLDEPTAGLDPQSRHSTWELVADLRQAGVAVVLTTHYLEEAEQLADHVVIVDAGEVVAEGSPTELTASLGGEVLRFTAPPRLDLSELRVALQDGATATEVSPGSYYVAGKVAAELLATVTQWCGAHGVAPTSLATERPSLQDVFLAVTGHELRS
jgi:ABC-2 type transport system ATP-binding protein